MSVLLLSVLATSMFGHFQDVEQTQRIFYLLHLDTPCSLNAYVPSGVFHCLQCATPVISLEKHTNQQQKEQKRTRRFR